MDQIIKNQGVAPPFPDRRVVIEFTEGEVVGGGGLLYQIKVLRRLRSVRGSASSRLST